MATTGPHARLRIAASLPMVLGLALMLCVSSASFAQGPEASQDKPGRPEKPAKPAVVDAVQAQEKPLTVAVLDFDAGDLPVEDLGSMVSETVAVMLASEPGIEMVDRASMQQTLSEHALNLSGLVETSQAIRVGQLVGARVLIVGRIFQLGERTFITAKMIGTETSRVDGVLVQGDAEAAVDQLVMQLADKIGQRLRESGAKLVASNTAIDPLPGLREALKGRKLPRVAVVITEEEVAATPVASAPDPAAETEVKRLLRSVGITVQDVGANDLAKWAPKTRWDQEAAWPRELGEVDLVLTGAGFSQQAMQIGNLQSAAARVEVNLIDRQSGQVLVAERATERAVDVAGAIAGKSALQKAGRSVAIEVLRYLVEHLPEAEAEAEAETTEDTAP